MSEKEYELFRVNTKLPREYNEWLDEQSKITGISKSTLIMLAVETYINQKTVMKSMGDIGELMQKFDELREAVERKELE